MGARDVGEICSSKKCTLKYALKGYTRIGNYVQDIGTY